jgi:hypothetical protein
MPNYRIRTNDGTNSYMSVKADGFAILPCGALSLHRRTRNHSQVCVKDVLALQAGCWTEIVKLDDTTESAFARAGETDEAH